MICLKSHQYDLGKWWNRNLTRKLLLQESAIWQSGLEFNLQQYRRLLFAHSWKLFEHDVIFAKGRPLDESEADDHVLSFWRSIIAHTTLVPVKGKQRARIYEGKNYSLKIAFKFLFDATDARNTIRKLPYNITKNAIASKAIKPTPLCLADLHPLNISSR